MTMVFLHLFNRAENVDLCINSVYLFNIPLTSQLAKFAEICVPLYLFLSGYGLYILYLTLITQHYYKLNFLST